MKINYGFMAKAHK